MTDRYPPFQLDMGGHDPGTLALPPPAGHGLPGGSAMRRHYRGRRRWRDPTPGQKAVVIGVTER